jgi:hypothetical protein
MSCDSATGSERRRRSGAAGDIRVIDAPSVLSHAPLLLKACWVVAVVAFALAAMAGCSTSKKGKKPSRPVLTAKQGESTIQVTESEEDGAQIVRINTRYKGEDHAIVMQIDQANYDIEIPLTLEQIQPPSAAAGAGGAGARGSEGQFQDLLIAQYFDKAQEAMLAGDYPGALRQVNLVLLTRPDHVQGHAMKGSTYYAMGNYQLAEDEWQRTLQLDPSNQEVRTFLDFLKNRKGAPQPPLPAAPGAGTGTAAPKAGAAAGAGQPPATPAPPRRGGTP